MTKYKIEYSVKIFAYVEVEAESEDEALEKAEDLDLSLSSYLGNGCGGRCDKLIGTRSEDLHLEEIFNEFEYESISYTEIQNQTQ